MINPLNLSDFHELIYFYVEHVLVRKIAEIPEDKREHLPNYLNQRLVTNGKSKNGMKGRKLLSTLNDDFTVELQDWRPEGFVDEGGRMSVQDKVLKAARDLEAAIPGSAEALRREELRRVPVAQRPRRRGIAQEGHGVGEARRHRRPLRLRVVRLGSRHANGRVPAIEPAERGRPAVGGSARHPGRRSDRAHHVRRGLDGVLR